MKSIACLILATLCAGCGHMNLGNLGAAMQGQQDYQARQMGVYTPPRQEPKLEYMCFSNCTSLNQYSYAFCKAKCSY